MRDPGSAIRTLRRFECSGDTKSMQSPIPSRSTLDRTATPGRQTLPKPAGLHPASPILSLVLLLAVLSSSDPSSSAQPAPPPLQPAQNQPAQEPPPTSPTVPRDAFHWIDFRDSKDAATVAWVTKTLSAEKWTAIREIGVQWDAALVLTTDRVNPQAMPAADIYTIWNVSLAQHQAQPLFHAVHPVFVNFTSFGAVGLQAPELGLVFSDCVGCDAPSTFFTTVFYNLAEHAWRARWIHGDQAATLTSGVQADGVTRTDVYGLLADLSGHNLLGTWSHYDYGRAKPAEDFLFTYSVDPGNQLEQTLALSGKPAEAMKEKLCRLGQGQSAASLEDPAAAMLASGQDSDLCSALIGAKPHSARRPNTTPPANNRGRSTPRK